jgi:hypothetical protein
MRLRVHVRVLVRVRVRMRVLVLVHRELRGRHSGAQHLVGMNVHLAERETSERAFQFIERQTRIEQRADRHVTGDAGKTIEIQDAHSASVPGPSSYNLPDFLKL